MSANQRLQGGTTAATAQPLAASTDRVAATWRDYLTLAKPEITFLVTVSSLAGYLVGSTAGIDFINLAVTLIGIALCSASASAMNHANEAHLDAQMKRTSKRPIPSGVISVRNARLFGYITAAAGVGILCPIVNPLTAILGAFTIILYVYVYTPLKQKTTLNTLVGTLPGALPVLGGYTAATGSVAVDAFPLFAVLACWQMPHFLSLAWIYRDDYASAGFKMLPSMESSGKRTGFQASLFALATLAASLSLAIVTDVSLVYIIGTTMLGLYFCYRAIQFALDRNKLSARRLFKASIWYVPALLVLMVIEHFM